MAAKVLLVLAAALSVGSAALSLFHGRLSGGVTLEPVQGVVALGLGGTPVSQFLDCNGTQNDVGNLRWRKDNEEPRFEVQVRTSEIRLDLSTAQVSDEGIYVCMDIVTRESVSINVTGGSLAICPAAAEVSVVRGSSAFLRVYVSSILTVLASEIVWTDPKQQVIMSSSRYTLVDSNTALRITNTEVEDNGMYSIAINKRVFGNSFLNVSTVITLNIQVPPTVNSNPMDMSILEHEDVTLTCIFTGNPKPVITWQREGGNLPVESRTETTQNSDSKNDTTGVYTVESTYTITGVFVSDEGRYRCSASNTEFPVAVESEYARLQIMSRLQLTVTVNSVSTPIPESSILSISDGSTVSVTCRGSGVLMWSSASGTVIPLVTTLPTSDNIYQRRDTSSNTQDLVIANFGSSNQNEYTCSTNTDNGQITESILLAGSLAIYISSPIVYTSIGADANIIATFVGSGTITWMFNGQTIDSTMNSRYTTVTTPTSQTLQVHNVGSDVLGTYTVMISSGGDNQTDSVQLTLPDPPTAIVTPTVVILNEGDDVQFNCTAGGTFVTQRWTRNGVSLTTTEQLVVSSVTTDSAGSYVCEVFGLQGRMARSTATLHVNFSPTIEVRELITMASSTQVLNITRQDGDSKVIFSCQSEGFPDPTITWSRAGGLPTGVAVRRLNSEQMLEWTRNLVYTDSGVYQCTSQNRIGVNTVIINFLVEDPPVVTSIFATSPVMTTSTSSFSVPSGYTGNVLTCSGLAWPPPLIEWVTAGEMPTETSSTTTGQVPFVSAKLAVSNFGSTDVGNYSCIVRAQDGSGRSHVETVTLTLNSNPITSDSPAPECVVNSASVQFQLRVLDADCENLISSQNTQILAGDIQSELLNVINTKCTNCFAMTDSISILVNPSCSEAVTGAILFSGTISTGSQQSTESVFCTLNDWIQSKPLIRVSNALYSVDNSCLLASGGSPTECVLPMTTTGGSNELVISMTVLIAICAGGGGLLLIIVLIVTICCCWCCYRSRRKGGMNMKRRPAPYERTSHIDRGARYTEQVNPENRIDGSLESPPPVYSTLDRSRMESLSFMPPTPNDIEMNPLRRDSEQPLIMSSSSSTNGRMFVIPSNAPQPYTEAVSSTEHLDQVGVTAPPNYNITSTAADRLNKSFPLQQPPNSNFNPSRRVTLASNQAPPVSTHAMIASRRTMSESTPICGPQSGGTSTPQYEVVTTRPNATFAGSSPRLQGAAGRVTSAGTVRPAPAGPFRRYRSAIAGGDEAPSSVTSYEPYDEEDYENLGSRPPHSATVIPGRVPGRIPEGRGWDRGINTRGAHGSTLPTSGISASSAAILTGGHRQVSRKASLPEKRVSVTSYSRGSPVNPRDSVGGSVSKIPLSPTEEMLPSYREAILSDSSMIENDAYQTATEATKQVEVQHQMVQSPNSTRQDTERHWYNGNSSQEDNHGPQNNGLQNQVPRDHRPSTTRFSLTPYSQVSNQEIDARTAENPRYSRNLRNISPHNEPTPYAEPVSSVEDLTRVGAKPSYPSIVLV